MELRILVPAGVVALARPPAPQALLRPADSGRPGRRGMVARAFFEGVSLVLGPSENGLPLDVDPDQDGAPSGGRQD